MSESPNKSPEQKFIPDSQPVFSPDAIEQTKVRAVGETPEQTPTVSKNPELKTDSSLVPNKEITPSAEETLAPEEVTNDIKKQIINDILTPHAGAEILTDASDVQEDIYQFAESE